ncbi:AMP-binding enzyme family protein [Histomonas meleagridis]|uniref:AMP-binding enzyme family protein n=1 Tax=Histomonas meleagridis TaxID=135588 RepID=UPI003559C85E|nr:AMP-binding enzyme family protein [Histomonas meleagridis]KAH0798199.1 AMP-binding enzyme family protein [Histomonas meleagridis]
MGLSQSKTAPPGTYSAYATGEDITPYAIRRHPKYADGVLQLPEDLRTGQDVYLKSMEKYKEREYVGRRKLENGVLDNKFTFITYSEAYKISSNFASGLSQLGVENRTFVAILSENRPEWILAADASYLIGFTTVHLFSAFALDALEYSIKNCGTQYIILSRNDFSKFQRIKDEVLKQFKEIILFDDIIPEDQPFIDKIAWNNTNLRTFKEVCELGKNKEPALAEIDPEQIMYICYSSGTTGFPKGVMISHRSFVTNLIAIHSEYCDATYERHISYLPLCHVFEKMCSSCTLYSGGKIGVFSGSIPKLSEDMQILKPTCLCCVPRVLQRMNDAVNSRIKSSSIIVRTIFNVAFYVKEFLLMHDMPTFIPDIIVFNKIKSQMGGCVTQICNGSAAIVPAVHREMQVILGVPIRTGYGLSEGGSGNTLSPPQIKYIKYGTNGYPLSNVEIRISKVDGFDDPGVGEIQMGGTGLCSGYLNDPEGTKNLFTDETHTWIHTGDIGKFDEDNVLLVVDRMRSIFKLSQGEYVAAELLGTFYEEAPLIQNIFIYGDASRSYLVGIVIPSKADVEVLLGKKLNDNEFKAACDSIQVIDAIMNQMHRIEAERELLGYQKVKKIKCVNDEWTMDNGCISPTYKVRRRELTVRYQDEIEALYNE